MHGKLLISASAHKVLMRFLYEAIRCREYAHHLIALYSSAGKQASLFDKDTYELVRELTEAIQVKIA